MYKQLIVLQLHLVFLIYQKTNSKNDLGVERTVNEKLGDLNTKLQTIADTKEKIESLQRDMLDFNNLFSNINYVFTWI